jgi:6-pyruvoyltetrahydropterin/6-carboxytetrahydropterin synthase
MTTYITRRERFNAAHRLFKPEYSDEKNLEIFGKCSNPNWHGHNYTLYVTVKGTIQAETGFVMNLKTLSSIIKQYIIDPLDHKNINLEVPFMKDIIPTTENIAVAIWKELEIHLTTYNVSLHKIRIEETENNSVEYYGH